MTCARCFPAGTLVATPTGLRLIQTLHVGDTVLAEDPTPTQLALCIDAELKGRPVQEAVLEKK